MSEEEKETDDDRLAVETMVKEIFTREKKKIFYTYDFGDDWNFSIKLDKIVETDENLPKVVRWKWWFLIEDVGGVWGLEDLIEIYENKDETKAEELWYKWDELVKILNNTVFKKN